MFENTEEWHRLKNCGIDKNVKKQKSLSSEKLSGRISLNNPFTPKSVKAQNWKKISNFILQDMEKQIVPYESTAQQLSFEWSHSRVLSTYVNVGRNTIIINWLDACFWECKGYKAVVFTLSNRSQSKYSCNETDDTETYLVI